MGKKNEMSKFFIILVVFLCLYFLPIELIRFRNPLFEALALVKWYAREHVILCLIPAFFIAGGISVFVSQASVLKYFGAEANKILSYGVASVSGTILAVCSCTVLPLFSSIYKRGAGIGPATAFLYSGPAINVLAIIMTARILGWQIGLARAIGAIIFSIIIGLTMHIIFIKEERTKKDNKSMVVQQGGYERTLAQTGIYFGSMIAILVFANWANPKSASITFWTLLYQFKWHLTFLFLVVLGATVVKWFHKDELVLWVESTWTFAKQIFPLLFVGVFIAGFLLGRPGHEGLIPSAIITRFVGGNSLSANFFASIVGAFMYFATLTEVPILQGLLGAGMGKGPALALLLSGPALSLPSMLVLKTILGTKKTVIYVMIVVVMSTIAGMIFGYMVK